MSGLKNILGLLVFVQFGVTLLCISDLTMNLSRNQRPPKENQHISLYQYIMLDLAERRQTENPAAKNSFGDGHLQNLPTYLPLMCRKAGMETV